MGDGAASRQRPGAPATSPPAVAAGSNAPTVDTTPIDAPLAVTSAAALLTSSSSSSSSVPTAAYHPPLHHEAPSAASTVNMAATSNRPSFNMAALGGALPDMYPYTQHHPSHGHRGFSPGASVPAIAYQLHQASQYSSPSAMAQQQPNQPPYGMPYQQQQYPPVYPPNQQLPQPLHSPTSPYYAGQGYQLPAAPPGQQPPYYYSNPQYGQQGQIYGNPYPPPGRSGSGAMDAGTTERPLSAEQSGYAGQSPRIDRQSSITSQSSAPRGPPRKPKQSGHALWVGNLPPGAKVVNLKDHFSRDATDDIESVFLISKSNCAFVNYKTEAACAAAMTRFHDSRFQGVRLVCRLRRSSANTAAPAAAASPHPPEADAAADAGRDAEPGVSASASGKVPEKFFVVKSLTVEDLDLSVRNRSWATQSHNEETLNNAYQAADNVYLIFSANKSGEYFGYARMASPINDDPSAAIELAPKSQATDESDQPKAIPTPATEFAPRGRIIDDSARGTIFWEAESSESDTEDNDEPDEPDAEAKTWGKPFKVEWMSTTRVPFYRTRGMRNPWNSNREVKIARDGTELETSVGRRLLTMFHREASPNPPQGLTGVPMGPMMGRFGQQY